MEWIQFFGLVLAGLAGMEPVSYFVHRFLFHGPLWAIHETHHRPAHGAFELNDVFSTFFALVSISFLVAGRANPLGSILFPLGVGIALYGLLYFVIHDLYTHRRFLPFRSRSALMQTVRRAHQRHHQTIDKHGMEPFGLFLFPYERFGRKFERRKSVVPVNPLDGANDVPDEARTGGSSRGSSPTP